MRDFVAGRMGAVPPSGIRRFFDIIATMPDVISLGVGEPDFITPMPLRQAAIDSIIGGKTQYTSNSGILELRNAISADLANRHGVEYDPRTEILVTVGSSEALGLVCLATLDPGDEVIIPEPCFVAYGPSVQFAGGVPVYVPTYESEDFQPDIAAIAAAITPRTKAIMIGYPNNPTGAAVSREVLMQIAALAEKHDLLVYSDEIYNRLVYGGAESLCFAALPGMRERSVTLNGFSKAYAMTGWRVGYIAAPLAILTATARVHQYMIMSAPTAGQYAALAAMTDPRGEEAVLAMTAEYDRRRRFVVDGFNSMGLRTFEPRGAFYVFPHIGDLGIDADTFTEKLLFEEKVAVVPGGAFGPSGAKYVRACYATSYEKLEVALERTAHFVTRVKAGDLVAAK